MTPAPGEALAGAGPAPLPPIAPPSLPEGDDGAVARFRTSMEADLDTPGALAGIFELVTEAHSAADAGAGERADTLAATAGILCRVLGLALHSGAGTELDPVAARLAAERDAARAAKDWQRADELRTLLVEAGWTVEDGPEGTVLRR